MHAFYPFNYMCYTWEHYGNKLNHNIYLFNISSGNINLVDFGIVSDNDLPKVNT